MALKSVHCGMVHCVHWENATIFCWYINQINLVFFKFAVAKCSSGWLTVCARCCERKLRKLSSFPRRFAPSSGFPWIGRARQWRRLEGLSRWLSNTLHTPFSASQTALPRRRTLIHDWKQGRDHRLFWTYFTLKWDFEAATRTFPGAPQYRSTLGLWGEGKW